ncbi:MAG TPA: pyridoxal-phosphate dependent enzyme [Solirubrobacteraceae bacterium]|jgi:threonine dehydratase|nr:pyridoxal-phosphate dependent enzyme [Solirubrobacteraceae bacterium]
MTAAWRSGETGAAQAEGEAHDFAELSARVDLDAALEAIARGAIATPTIASADLSERAGGPVVLKAESLQVSGSFKLRGAIAKLAALGDAARGGLIAASAGNHARAVAQAARIAGVSCEVFMPRDAPVSKVAAVERLGARVVLSGDSVEESLELAKTRAGETSGALIHPFDDLDVIAGQGTLGLELLRELPDLARVVVPVGGGGLASGIGLALRRERPDVELVGVQAGACATLAQALRGGVEASPDVPSAATIADGIALKRPGRLTLPLLRELLSSVETVDEEQIAGAMVFLAERAKLVAEGAGAVAVAALLGGQLAPVAGTTAAIVSGGNVDNGLLASLLRRHETVAGRRVRMFTRVPDRPGGLAELLELVADTRANLLTLEHVREAVSLNVRETGVELTLETRGPEHTDELRGALERAGYDVSLE